MESSKNKPGAGTILLLVFLIIMCFGMLVVVIPGTQVDMNDTRSYEGTLISYSIEPHGYGVPRSTLLVFNDGFSVYQNGEHNYALATDYRATMAKRDNRYEVVRMETIR